MQYPLHLIWLDNPLLNVPRPFSPHPHRNIAEKLHYCVPFGAATGDSLPGNGNGNGLGARGNEGEPMQPCSFSPPPLLFALSPTIYSYILLWRIFSAKVFLARLVLWMKTFSVCAWLGLLGCPQKGVALLCFVFVSLSLSLLLLSLSLLCCLILFLRISCVSPRSASPFTFCLRREA